MANEIPVYLFVGFLESGKTKFIQETFEDPNFDSGDKTLLLVCEEGEEEYSQKKFAFPGVTLYNLEDKAELNPQNLAKLAKEADAGRVVIEYNGMWMLQDLANNLPENWIVYQCIATADGTTALTYARDNSMRALMLDKIARSELIVFNRAEAVNNDAARQELHKLVRQASRKCDIAYEFADGSVAYDDIPDPLPFDINAPVIEIPDDDFGILVYGLPGRAAEVRRQDRQVSGAGLPDQPRRQEQLCSGPFCHDLLRTGYPVRRLPLLLRWLQGPRAARVGRRDRKGQLQVPQHLPRQRPGADRHLGGAGYQTAERCRNLLLN